MNFTQKSTTTSSKGGSWHEVQSNDPALGFGDCIAWIWVWLLRKVLKNFSIPTTLCAAEAFESAKMAGDKALHLSQAKCLEQNGRCVKNNELLVPEEEIGDPVENVRKHAVRME